MRISQLENMQLKAIQNNGYRQNWRDTNIRVEVMNSEAHVKRELGHVVQIHVFCFPEAWL